MRKFFCCDLHFVFLLLFTYTTVKQCSKFNSTVNALLAYCILQALYHILI